MPSTVTLKRGREDTFRLQKTGYDGRTRDLKIAVVHDWLITYGGAERVLEQIFSIFPQADLFTLFDYTPDDKRAYFLHKQPTTSFLQSFPFARKRYRSYLPLMPLAVEQFDLTGYDIVISSSHAVAHGVLTSPEQLHITYFNNTMIYAWDLYHHYLKSGNLRRGPLTIPARLIMHYIRNWDSAAAMRSDIFIANSRHMARRINKIYGSASEVIYPPVAVNHFSLKPDKGDFYIVVSRLVPFKRIDLIVEAFRQMPDKKLVILGDGPELRKLAGKATPNIRFLGFQPRELVNDYVRRAKAIVFSSVEPFGISLVEAQACGTPAIAYAGGAVPEIIRHGDTGLLYDEQTPQGIIDAVSRFEPMRHIFDANRLRENSLRFASDRFRREFSLLVAREAARKFGISVSSEPVSRISTPTRQPVTV